jgi:hypothetical protein
VAGAPALGQLGDQHQAAAVLVVAVGAAQLRSGAAAVEDLAAEHAVQDHPELDGLVGVPDGVGDQLAHQQLGREGDLFQAPGRQLAGGTGAGVGHDSRVGRQVPGRDPVRGQGARARDEQRRVVAGLLGEQRIDQAVADGVQRREGRTVRPGVNVAQNLPHRAQPGVDVPLP